ncbi:oligosaccharide flippase family protein [Mesorhizobium sp. M0633]
MITARVLGPEGRGILAIVMTWGGLFATLVQISISDAVVLLAGASNRDQVEHAALSMARLLSVLLAPVCAGAMYIVMMGYGEGVPVLVGVAFAFFSALFGIIGDMYRGILRSRQKFFYLQAFTVSQPLIYCGFCIASFMFSPSVEYFVAAQIVSIGIVFAMRAATMKVGLSGAPNWHIGKQLLTIAATLHLSTAVRLFTAQADRIAVALLWQPEIVGHYAVAVTLSSLFTGVFSTAIRSVALPAFANRTSDNLSRVVLRIMRLTWVASFAGTAVTIILAPAVAPILFGEQFATAGTMASLLATAYAFNPVKDVLFETCKILRQSRIIVFSHVWFIIVFLLVSASTVDFIGIYSVILAILVANVASLLFVSMMVKRKLPDVTVGSWLRPRYATLAECLVLVSGAISRQETK